MASGRLNSAPIWPDVASLAGTPLRYIADIVYGGFPCQDISIAGLGKGLAGERSGLFFEIVRLAKEIKAQFIFLENVPAICSRGGIEVVRTIAEMGYDCRWCVISAASVGALHRRERWFLLAHANGSGSGKNISAAHGDEGKNGQKDVQQSFSICTNVAYAKSERLSRGGDQIGNESTISKPSDNSQNVADSRFICERCEDESKRTSFHDPRCGRFWEVEPDVGRVADGIPKRVDRVRALGNAVVPQQAKEAFKILMGLAEPPKEKE
jgi:DNA (cytosine-5)-methyltransferase 1